MHANKNLRKTTTSSKEYKAACGLYEWVWTVWVDTKPYRNWKLYRTNQYKTKK